MPNLKTTNDFSSNSTFSLSPDFCLDDEVSKNTCFIFCKYQVSSKNSLEHHHFNENKKAE